MPTLGPVHVEYIGRHTGHAPSPFDARLGAHVIDNIETMLDAGVSVKRIVRDYRAAALCRDSRFSTEKVRSLISQYSRL